MAEECEQQGLSSATASHLKSHNRCDIVPETGQCMNGLQVLHSGFGKVNAPERAAHSTATTE